MSTQIHFRKTQLAVALAAALTAGGAFAEVTSDVFTTDAGELGANVSGGSFTVGSITVAPPVDNPPDLPDETIAISEYDEDTYLQTTTTITAVGGTQTTTTTATGGAEIDLKGNMTLTGGFTKVEGTKFDLATIVVVDQDPTLPPVPLGGTCSDPGGPFRGCVISETPNVKGFYDGETFVAGPGDPLDPVTTVTPGGNLTMTGTATIGNGINVSTLTPAGTPDAGTLVVTDGTAQIGVENAGGHINGLYADTTSAKMTGGTGTTNWTLTDAGAVLDSNSLVTFQVDNVGNASVTNGLTVGGATLTNGLTSTGPVQVNSTLGVTGLTSTAGIQNVGNILTTTLNTTGDAAVGGNASVAGNLGVTGATTTHGITNNGLLTTTALTVTNGPTTINGGATINNGATVNGLLTTNNGIANTGNIGTDTLSTTGLATLASLQVNGASTTNGITNTGNITNSGLVDTQTLNVKGASTTNGITNTGNIATDTLSTTGNASIGGNAAIAGNATVGGTLGVTGLTTTTGIVNNGSLTNNGNAAITGNATVGGTLGVTGLTTTTGIVNNGSLTNNGNAQVNGTLGVTGATSLGSTLTVAGATTVNNAFTVNTDGDASVSDNNSFTVAATGAPAGTGGVRARGNDATLVVDGSTASLQNSYGSYVRANGSAAQAYGNGASMDLNGYNASVTNYDGHGLNVYSNSTVLSGGTGTSYLTLSDSGAAFSNSSGGPIRVTGVADGRNKHDAVNKRQLDSVEDKSNAGIAAAVALASIPAPAAGKQYTVGIGWGNYESENAFALGGRAQITPEFQVTAGWGYSNEGNAFNVGAGYSW